MGQIRARVFYRYISATRLPQRPPAELIQSVPGTRATAPKGEKERIIYTKQLVMRQYLMQV